MDCHVGSNPTTLTMKTDYNRIDAILSLRDLVANNQEKQNALWAEICESFGVDENELDFLWDFVFNGVGNLDYALGKHASLLRIKESSLEVSEMSREERQKSIDSLKDKIKEL